MEQWNTCPHVLKQKTIFTLLTGTCCMGITVPVFLLSKDHVLLALGSCFFLGSLLRALSVARTALHQQYDTVTGVCIGRERTMFCRYQKIYFIDDGGNETALLLEKKLSVREGHLYRFYFQPGYPAPLGNNHLALSLTGQTFLGYEELPNNLLCPPAK